MKTVSHCLKCNKTTTKDDYYWQHTTGCKVYSECKECVLKRKSERRLKKGDFLYQYFN